MKLSDVFRMAIGNLLRNKMRTVLTVAGVVVGIGAIVFLVSLGFGVQAMMVRQVADLDALTIVTVRPGSQEDTVITEDIVKRFESLEGVAAVSPALSFPAQISFGDEISDTVVYGVEPEFLRFEEARADYGERELKKDSHDAIISVASLESLNLTDPDRVIGRELDFRLIKVDEAGNVVEGEETSTTFEVVGMTSEDEIKYTYVPLSAIAVGGDQYSSVKIQAAERDQVEGIRKAVESMGFPTSSVKDTVDQIDQAFVIVNSVLFSFGMIALFVAAIGIFNTMTISLLERTHEIGIMKAIGGRSKDVSRVFVAEAALIGLMGGLFGILAGWTLGFLINSLVNFVATSVGGAADSYFLTPLNFSIYVILFSFGVSTFAGIWPAKRASKLNPLEALRYE